MMFGYKLLVNSLTNAQVIEQHPKIISYDFKNTGETIANIRLKDGANDSWVWTLYPGEAMNTHLFGGRDLSIYAVDFKSENDTDPEAQQSEILVTRFIGI